MVSKRLLVALVISVFIMVGSQCYAGDLHGTGDNFGSGWRQDSSGNWQGTGSNSGGGWRQDSSGNIQGTGDNFGSGYRQDSEVTSNCRTGACEKA